MDKLIEKMRPQMYCFVGSEMLTNTFNEKEQIRNAEICANITKEVACGFAGWIEDSHIYCPFGEKKYYDKRGDLLANDAKELFDIYIKSL